MKEAFEDICITGKPDPAKVRAGSKSYTNVFLFPLSAAPPQRWNELLVQEWVYRVTQNPRHIWVNRKELAVDCPGEELASIVERVGADMQIVNRKFRHEVESNRNQTDPERQQAVDDKRLDDAAIKKVIEELVLPGYPG